jgi:hypothetical protein
MTRDKHSSTEPGSGTEDLLSQPGFSSKPSSLVERSNPFIWVSWLSKVMAGEKQCEWACWFRSHYQWEKLPSGLDLAKWTADHAQLLRRRQAALEVQGFTVYIEDQNSFTLIGETGIEVSGKPDIVAIRGKEVYVEDCKTGSPRHSDHLQVLLYMLALPHVEGPWRGLKIEGRIVYENSVVDVPSSKIDADLKELFRKTVQTLGGPKPARKVPSRSECRYCDISQADCPERVEIVSRVIGNHGLF